jgi:hypothetical protein
MSSGQSMLVLGATVLFALISLRFNTAMLENTTLEIQNKVNLTAFSLADDLIEEIKEKAFDATTVDFQAIDVTQLTAANALGHNSSESWPNFNDIDDYNGYSKIVDLPHAEGYTVTCMVKYVDSDGSELSTQSFHKKVTIAVASKYLNNPITMAFIFSLHSKN